jgi:tetratricopeptide (TPR) repeat protein
MKRILLLITVTLITGIQALALSSFPPDMLVNKPFGQRYFYLDLIYVKFLPAEDSIRFFARAEEIRQLGKETGDRDLELEADLLELNYLMRSNTIKDRTPCTDIITKLLNTAINEKNTILLARTHNMAAAWYWEKNYEKSFEHHHAEYELIKDMSVDEYPCKQKSLYELGNSYWFFRDYTNAMRYMKEAANTDIFSNNLYFTLQATNTLGLCYQHLGNLDSADYFFQRANAIAVTVSNDAWDGITSGNIGYDLYKRQQFDNAMPLLQKDLDLSVKRSDYGSASGSLIIIAEINLAKGDVALAEKQANQAREWIQSAGEFGRLKTYYTLMSKLQQQKENLAVAKAYGDSSIMVQDNLEAKLAALHTLRIQQKAELEQERQAAERSQKFTSIITAVLAIFAAGVISFSVVRLILQYRTNGLSA